MLRRNQIKLESLELIERLMSIAFSLELILGHHPITLQLGNTRILSHLSWHNNYNLSVAGKYTSEGNVRNICIK
jgi:hypothetical protein